MNNKTIVSMSIATMLLATGVSFAQECKESCTSKDYYIQMLAEAAAEAWQNLSYVKILSQEVVETTYKNCPWAADPETKRRDSCATRKPALGESELRARLTQIDQLVAKARASSNKAYWHLRKIEGHDAKVSFGRYAHQEFSRSHNGGFYPFSGLGLHRAAKDPKQTSASLTETLSGTVMGSEFATLGPWVAESGVKQASVAGAMSSASMVRLMDTLADFADGGWMNKSAQMRRLDEMRETRQQDERKWNEGRRGDPYFELEKRLGGPGRKW
ncbi:MAG: hypothetical protein AABZ44_10585 [Elusimicrobiota bacterium]